MKDNTVHMNLESKSGKLAPDGIIRTASLIPDGCTFQICDCVSVAICSCAHSPLKHPNSALQ